MSEVYMNIDLVEMAKNTDNSADVLRYAGQQYNRGKITQSEFLSVFNSLDTSFSSVSLDMIGAIADLYYSGALTLNNVKSKWAIGNTKTISVSSMAATGVSESHAAQNVTMRIVDFEHDKLAQPIRSKTKALITFGFMLNETGEMGNTNEGGWNGSARRVWCNNVCINALPIALKNSIKPVKKENGDGSSSGSITPTSSRGTSVTVDKLFIPNLTEVYIGGYAPGIDRRTYHIDQDGASTRYTYYATGNNYNQNVNYWTATSAQYYYNGGDYWVYNLWMYITSDGAKKDDSCSTKKKLFIHGCI